MEDDHSCLLESVLQSSKSQLRLPGATLLTNYYRAVEIPEVLGQHHKLVRFLDHGPI